MARVESPPVALRALGAFLLLVLLAAPARADTEAIHIDYEGAPGCPTEDEFLRQVFRRTSSARLVPETENARTFVISIVKNPVGVEGSLVIRETNGTTVARKVTGAVCSDVAGVLALATALAIDPNAALVAPDTPETPEQPVVRPPPEPRPRRPPPPDPGPGPDPAPLPEEPWSYGAGIGPVIEGLVAPRIAVGGSASLRAYRTSLSTPSSFGIELSVLRALTSSLGTAKVTHLFFFARPDACLVSLGEDSFSLMPCLGFELGGVMARGSGLSEGATRTRFWATTDFILRAHIVPGDAWFLDLDASLVLPLTRYSFVFRDPDTRIHTVPPLAGAAALRAGFLF